MIFLRAKSRLLKAHCSVVPCDPVMMTDDAGRLLAITGAILQRALLRLEELQIASKRVRIEGVTNVLRRLRHRHQSSES